MGLYSKVFGGMVRIGCKSLCAFRIFGAWWLHMIMVVVEGSYLVDILAQWDSFYARFMVWWVCYSNTHPF